MRGLRPALAFLDEHLEYILIVLFYSYFVVIIILEVILRYGFNQSTVIGEETARHAFIWLAWIAASLAAKKRIHISIAVVEQKLSQRGQYFMNFFYNGLFLLLCVIGLKYIYPIIESQYQYETLSRAARYPMYLVYMAIPLGYALMALRVVQNIVIDWRDMKAGRPIRKGLTLF